VVCGKKPENIFEYKNWLKNSHSAEISDRSQTYYESVADRISRTLQQSQFWVEMIGCLHDVDGEYSLITGYPLFELGHRPQLCVKPFESFLLKTFRKNILNNKNWPSEPQGGWLLPSNWFTKINDMMRTLFVVKYLDGVQFMIEKLQSLCKSHDLDCNVYLEAREEGYYAAHVYTRMEFEIPRINWETEKVIVPIELQITTQLQEVIRKLLHKYYEDKRKRTTDEVTKWQWNYQSDEFVANYLGHILHYVEGMIVEVREKQKEDVLS
jgi:hypothetical protein